jgi:hypothetical protein
MNPLKKLLISAGGGQWYFRKWWQYRSDGEFISQWNRDKKTFFIHIPKTAGTSIYMALGMPVNRYTHMPLDVANKLYPQEICQMMTFTVVRNPHDRFASTFEYVTSRSDWPEQRVWSNEVIGDLNFQDFIQKMRTNQIFKNRIMGNEFFFPQTYWTHMDGKLSVDNVLRFEAVADDFKALFPSAGELPKARQHQAASGYAEHYTAEDAAFVAQLYQSDFDHFNYPTALRP